MSARAARAKREFGIALLATAIGAAGVVGAAGRTWVRGAIDMPGPLASAPVELTGDHLAPVASAMGWAGLAALAAVLATNGRARIAVGALTALFGGAALAALWSGTRPDRLLGAVAEQSTAAGAPADPQLLATWPAVAAAGATLLVAAGLFTAVRGPSWPGMGSRYDRHSSPAARTSTGPADPVDLWKSLDGGDDPTLDPRESGAAGPDGPGPRADPDPPTHDSARVTGAPAAQKEP